MTKKHFIELADLIKAEGGFTQKGIEHIADFCAAQNSNFNREWWLGYIKGENGPNGGRVK